MSMDNQITLRGFVTAEPKFRQTTQTATPVTEIRVGSTPRRLNRETGEWQDQPTSYYTVKCWRRLAINASSSLHKGDMVVVRGRFYMREWTDNEQRPRAALEIEADSMGHDLAYGWSHFLRGLRPQPAGLAGPDAGELARQGLGPSSASASGIDDEYPADAGREYPADAGREYPSDAGWDEPGGAAYMSAGEDGAPGPAEVLAASGVTGEVTLPEAAAVPF
jgi:single-strand DNA-binding protein